MNFQQLPTSNHDSMLLEIVLDIHDDNSSDQRLFQHLIFLSSWLFLFEKAKTLQNSKDDAKFSTKLNSRLYEKKTENAVKAMIDR